MDSDRTVEMVPSRTATQRHSNWNFRFNDEELRVLKQCHTESFYQRSLPIATVLSVGTYFAVKNGYLKGSLRFGAGPKMTIAAAVGYFIGKFSYREKCAEKLMQLSNSPIADILRKNQPDRSPEMLTDHGGLPWPSSEPTTETHHDLDFDRPMYDGLDDFSRPSLETPASDEETLPSPAPHRNVGYEELRLKNREEYDRNRIRGPFRPPTYDYPTRPRQQSPAEMASRPQPAWPNDKNKYGDVWEE